VEIENKFSISVEDVYFQYRLQKVIDGCSFKLEQGKIYCLLGKNGSGKSTIIKILNGIIKADKGTILMNGKDINNLSKKEKASIIGYVPQNHSGFFNYSVLDMVVMGRNPHKDFFQQPKSEDYKIAEEALNMIEISYLKERFFNELSGGEKQLVLIARVIAQDTKFLLLDEPTSHLDFYYQHQVLKAIKRIVKEKNISVLMAMHDPNLTVLFGDYIYMLKEGKIQNEGTVDKIMNKETLSSLYGMNIVVDNISNKKKIIRSAM